MKIVYEPKELDTFVRIALAASAGHPVLIDQFLEGAVEVDVDALSDGKRTIIGGIMEHIEAAGIHSGDSACVLPPQHLDTVLLDEIRRATRAMAAELGVVGLLNIQYAISNGRLYVLEANPRASRTVPFVSKATGVPLAKLATKVMLGRSLDELGLSGDVEALAHVSVKESVLPFGKFPDVDTLLGPEMKSTGEVMGIAADFGAAYAKAQLGAGQKLPLAGTVFVSVTDRDKPAALDIAARFRSLGFRLLATQGTARFLNDRGIACQMIQKVSLGRPHVVDAVKNKTIQLIVNTDQGRGPSRDGYAIRRAALANGVPYTTTLAGADAACRAIASLQRNALTVCPMQDHYRSALNRAG